MNIKKKRILFVVGIMILVCCVFAGSYAFWTVTKEQTDTNNLVAACLDLELIEETGTFGVNNAWPISDEEGLELEGYSFKVKNNCSETVNYIIGIDSLAIEGAEYLSNDNIKVSLDSGSPKVFGSLIDIERDNVRGSKQVVIKSIEANATNSHNIKLWIKSDANVNEQSKQFKGQVFITGGQGIGNTNSGDVLAESCFNINEEGLITSYDYNCGTVVSVPATINNVQVKTIDYNSFMNVNVYLYSLWLPTDDQKNDSPSGGRMIVIDNPNAFEKTKTTVLKLLLSECEGEDNCTTEKILEEYPIYSKNEISNLDLSQYELELAPVSKADPITGEIDFEKNPSSSVTYLDLSNAIYLEEIQSESFTGYYGAADRGECGEQTEGYCTSGVLENIVFPEDGELKIIDSAAFTNNKIASSIIIPDSVTELGDYAFANNLIPSVSLGTGLTRIEHATFANNLISGELTIPDSITYVDGFNNNQITSVKLGENVESITGFYNNQISYIDFNEKVISVTGFYNNMLETLTIPATVTSLSGFNNNQFSSANDITILANDTNDSYRFNSTWNTIGFPVSVERCFAAIGGTITNYYDWCSRSLEIPSVINGVTITSIGKSAFENKRITSVTIPYTIESVKANAFSDTYATLSTLIFEDTAEHPSRLSIIEYYAFSGAAGNKITSVVLPASVTTIGDYAFAGPLLSSFIITDTPENPSQLTSIGNNFISGSILTSFTIPASVTTLSYKLYSSGSPSEYHGAFRNTNLTSITIKGDSTRFDSIWNNVGLTGVTKTVE